MCVALHALVIVGVTGPVALQALVIVGVTGPVVFFTQTVHMMADTIDAPFLQFMGWICVWSGLMHVIVAGAHAHCEPSAAARSLLVSLCRSPLPLTAEVDHADYADYADCDCQPLSPFLSSFCWSLSVAVVALLLSFCHLCYSCIGTLSLLL